MSYLFLIASIQKRTTFERQCIKHEGTNWDTIFTSPTGDGTAIYTWSSEPLEGPAVCSAKTVPSFLSYFETLSIGPAPGIEPAWPPAVQLNALPTELVLPWE